MNILLISFIILAILSGWHGMKQGLVDEVGHLLSLVISLFVISLGILLYTSIQENDVKNIILSIIILLVTGGIAKLVKLMVRSLSTIAHLPIISMLNRILGIGIGVAEVIVVLWIVYVVIAGFDTGSFGAQIMAWTGESPLLQKLYDINQIAYWMTAGL